MVPKKSKANLKWSLVTSFWAFIIILSITSVFVFCLSNKPIWLELEFITACFSIVFFLYYFLVLYFGIQFDSREMYHISFKQLKPNWLNNVDVLSFPDAGVDLGEGIVGIVLSILFFIFISVLIVILITMTIWLGTNLLTFGIPVLFFPLYYLFKRSLRVFVYKGRRCYKNLIQSIFYSFYYTTLNLFWIYAVIFAGHKIALYFQKTI